MILVWRLLMRILFALMIPGLLGPGMALAADSGCICKNVSECLCEFATDPHIFEQPEHDRELDFRFYWRSASGLLGDDRTCIEHELKNTHENKPVWLHWEKSFLRPGDFAANDRTLECDARHQRDDPDGAYLEYGRIARKIDTNIHLFFQRTASAEDLSAQFSSWRSIDLALLGKTEERLIADKKPIIISKGLSTNTNLHGRKATISLTLTSSVEPIDEGYKYSYTISWHSPDTGFQIRWISPESVEFRKNSSGHQELAPVIFKSADILEKPSTGNVEFQSNKSPKVANSLVIVADDKGTAHIATMASAYVPAE